MKNSFKNEFEFKSNYYKLTKACIDEFSGELDFV